MNHIEKTLGTNPAKCSEEHELRNIYGVTILNGDFRPALLKIGGMRNPEDWDWARDKFGLTIDHTGLIICFDCELDKPSRLALIEANLARANKAKAIKKVSEDDVIAEARAEGTPMVQCPDCDLVMAEDEAVEVRFCTFCDTTFNGSDNGRNCEECNRPFTRKCTAMGCPDCLDEDNECQPYE
jgi:hypothetical protein